MEDEYLEHYGVKGMKWGQRRALNKTSRQQVRAKNVKTIERARGRVASGATDRAYAKAKAQYKKDKEVMGKAMAKQALYKAREKKLTDIYTSRTPKNGKEVALVLLTGGYGALALPGMK